jgi:hypothetical protein
MSSISPISSSIQSPQALTTQSAQQPAKAHHHGGGNPKSGGTQSSSSTDGTSGQLTFNPATGAMEPTGSFSTSA